MNNLGAIDTGVMDWLDGEGGFSDDEHHDLVVFRGSRIKFLAFLESFLLVVGFVYLLYFLSISPAPLP